MPLRVAVVGSGPAGFYAAGALLSAEAPVEVDMIERLPTPWGLVRLGVAPDHPKLKTVSRAFEKIAAQPGFRFLGNVEVGRDLTHEDLTRLYDAVIYAVGAQTDRRLGIPGEDLPGSWPATAFVAWYNGHPDFQDVPFDLDVERAVVIGVGNVALDVARMLALTHEELAPTDTADAAIEAIASSSLKEIVIVGRRGPAQAAFTTPELQEMGELAGADVYVDPADLEGAEPKDTNAERNLAVLHELAAKAPEGKPRRVVFKFFESPVAILGDERVEGIELVRNVLDENERAVATDVTETLACGLVFRSVGYRGVELPGIPFEERSGTIANEGGRVGDGVYCAGWIKRGPTGVIGTNKKDASETVELLLEDVASGRLAPKPDTSAAAIDAVLAERGVRVVEYDGWTAIDETERAAGETSGRPRVKLCSWDELLAAAERVGHRA
ncbi:MAG: ferredoxin/flavodoxin---NADP+ reductase [Gaiellaceae bacterium]|jgi:ferredoxin--NADP+ reductase|nr:ferredoxin/flavodoxin---NADP+ reductase [Gaiellaceae bacterium]